MATSNRIIKIEPDEMPTDCFGTDDCSTMMLAACKFSDECGIIAERDFLRYTMKNIKPAFYKKKPVRIEAIQFIYSQEGLEALAKFCGDSLGDYGKERHLTAVGWAEIGTLEDGGKGGAPQVKHLATEGDYIIKGVSGEFYACKPDIFKMTYDKE